MTSRFSAESDRHESSANAESSATARIADEGPYARPAAISPHRAVDAVLIDAIRASVGPFVPAPWRTVSAASTAAPSPTAPSFQEALEEATDDSSTALPWIESFMDTAEGDVDAAVIESSDPASMFAEAAGAVASYRSGAGEPDAVEASAVSHSPEAPVSESLVEAESASPIAEDWPLEEAGAAMRALADDLVRQEETPALASEPAAPSDSPSPVASTAPLGMWSDDDMMDIMPVKTPVAATESGEQWAARARRETQGAGNPESAALALEALARRVRSGEIQLPAFSAEMGEAAALAAALAALLGVRR